jgi:hypothetical protein
MPDGTTVLNDQLYQQLLDALQITAILNRLQAVEEALKSNDSYSLRLLFEEFKADVETKLSSVEEATEFVSDMRYNSYDVNRILDSMDSYDFEDMSNKLEKIDEIDTRLRNAADALEG